MTWPRPQEVLSHHHELLSQLEFAEANETAFSAAQTVGSPFFALTLDELGVAWRSAWRREMSSTSGRSCYSWPASRRRFKRTGRRGFALALVVIHW